MLGEKQRAKHVSHGYLFKVNPLANPTRQGWLLSS